MSNRSCSHSSNRPLPALEDKVLSPSMDGVGLKGRGEREVWPDIGQLVLKRSCKSLFSDFRFSSLPLKLCKRRQLDKADLLHISIDWLPCSLISVSPFLLGGWSFDSSVAAMSSSDEHCPPPTVAWSFSIQVYFWTFFQFSFH